MSVMPLFAEVLAERLGRDALEIEGVLHEALAEASRRRWEGLSPAQRADLEAELEAARDADAEPFPASDIVRMPLSLLPAFVRRARNDLAVARRAWQETQGAYQELLRRLTLWFHEEERLQITAAEKKAAIDPRVQAAAITALNMKQRVDALERAEGNLLQELEVRLVLVRAGVLPDPEAARATI